MVVTAGSAAPLTDPTDIPPTEAAAPTDGDIEVAEMAEMADSSPAPLVRSGAPSFSEQLRSGAARLPLAPRNS